MAQRRPGISGTIALPQFWAVGTAVLFRCRTLGIEVELVPDEVFFILIDVLVRVSSGCPCFRALACCRLMCDGFERAHENRK